MKNLTKFGQVKFNYPLAKLTTFKIGGPVQAVISVEKEELLLELIGYLKRICCPYYFLGKGSNVLALDNGYKGIVIKLALKDLRWRTEDDNVYLKIGAGFHICSLLNLCLKMGYSGLEFMAGIPATVGGAVASNAGNFRQSIGERIKQIKILLEDKIFWIDWTKEMYDYRQINLFAGAIILGAELRLKVSSIKNIRAFIKRYYKEKLTKQPLFSPSAGCVFKNPAHITAGQLVEKLGLKREKIGGAKVSEKHANFIINIDKAKAIHVLSLIEFIQEQVDKHTGIKLEPEIKLVQ